MPRRSAVFGDPAARRRFERVAHAYRLGCFEIADQLRRNPQHHRGFPLTRMPHLLLPQAGVGERRFCA